VLSRLKAAHETAGVHQAIAACGMALARGACSLRCRSSASSIQIGDVIRRTPAIRQGLKETRLAREERVARFTARRKSNPNRSEVATILLAAQLHCCEWVKHGLWRPRRQQPQDDHFIASQGPAPAGFVASLSARRPTCTGLKFLRAALVGSGWKLLAMFPAATRLPSVQIIQPPTKQSYSGGRRNAGIAQGLKVQSTIPRTPRTLYASPGFVRERQDALI